MALIEVKDLYKIYNPGENEVRALDGVSLTIDRGEFVAIIGHSGSGKSTFMNMLGLLDVPTSGEYKLDGHNTSKLSDDEMSEIRNKEIGFIFRDSILYRALPRRKMWSCRLRIAVCRRHSVTFCLRRRSSVSGLKSE